MKLRFLGALGRVTGSCYWLQHEELGIEFLVDCGMVQGEADGETWNRGEFPFNATRIQFVLLTHAHLDHCGLLPLLYKAGFTGMVYATRETIELTKINLHDAARFERAPFKPQDVRRIRFHEPSQGRMAGFHPLGTDFFVQFLRSSHLMGAAAVNVQWGTPAGECPYKPGRSILFSGDVGMNMEEQESQPLLRPSMRQFADYLVLESTYGAKLRAVEEKDYEARLACLADAIRTTGIEAGGTLLIPVFALGRYQEVLFDLHLLAAREPETFGRIPILTMAPMGDKASFVYLQGLWRTAPNGSGVKPVWRSRQMNRLFGLDPEDASDDEVLRQILALMYGPGPFPLGVTAESHRSSVVRNFQRRHRCVTPSRNGPVPAMGGHIVVASGGMCEGGPIVELLPKLLPNPLTTIFFTGYQAVGTNGSRLLGLKDLPLGARQRLTDTLKWTRFDRKAQSLPLSSIEARIRVGVGYSGHADQAGLLDWTFCHFDGAQRIAGRRIFLTHGAEAARRGLQKAIEERARSLEGAVAVPEVLLPKPKDGWYDLDQGQWVEETDDDEIARLEARLAELKRRQSN